METSVENDKSVKSIFLSKTVWANIVAIAGFFVNRKFGYVIPPEAEVEILAFINVVLRTITHDAVRWK